MQPGQGVNDVKIDALDVFEARLLLERSGGIVLTLRPQRMKLYGLKSKARFSVPLFTQELISLLDSGLSLGEALEALTEKSNTVEVQQLLQRIFDALRQGRPFSVALAAQRGVFSTLYIATVRSAESTGDLSPALTRYLSYQQRLDVLRKQVIAASIYPTLLIAVGMLVITFLLVYVVPRFAIVYANSGRTPPWSTQLLLSLGQGIVQNAGLIILAVMALAGVTSYLLKLSTVRHRLGKLIWRIPGLGEPMRIFQLARFYRSLGMLLTGGIPIVQALDMVAPLLAANLRLGASHANEALRRGVSISQAFANGGLTTPVSLRLLQVGERSGRMGEMMDRVAHFNDEATAHTLEWVTRLLEPLLMVFIGLSVGLIVVLLYMPIFDLTGSIL